MSKILGIKNWFNNILKCDNKNSNDFNYVNLKLNVIFNKESRTESQIVEIQFLLDFLLKAKKLGHKYYGIKRKDVQIHSVNNIIENTYNNYNKFKTKISILIKENDVNQFARHLFLRPNCILSMINDKGEEYLYTVGKRGSSNQMYSLFLDCLFHFGEILLNEKKPNNGNIDCYKNFTND